jgi:hypothetical protein
VEQARAIEEGVALCVLREQSSPAHRTLVAQVPGALVKTGEDGARSGRANRAFPLRRLVRVREAASAPFRAELLAAVLVRPQTLTVHLEENGCLQRVEEELVAWAPVSFEALMIQSAHQGQLKMR